MAEELEKGAASCGITIHNPETVEQKMDAGIGKKIDVKLCGSLIEGVDNTVISGTMQPLDAQQMKLVGFDPRDYRVVVLKSANHYRAWWPEIASNIIDCDPP